MKLFKIAKKFNNDEDGAVTVDWVVLTAAVVGLGIAVLTQVRSGTQTVTDNVSSQLSRHHVLIPRKADRCRKGSRQGAALDFAVRRPSIGPDLRANFLNFAPMFLSIAPQLRRVSSG